MTNYGSIFLFSFLAATATIAGGSVLLFQHRLSDRHLSLLVAFSGGVLLSTGINHMIVESFAEAGRWAVVGVSLGFVMLYGYEKISMVHACREKECHVHKFGAGALIGMGFHSFLDGFAIAVSLEFEPTLGILVIIAVILHRLPTGVSLAAILLSHNYENVRAWRTLVTISLLAIFGAAAGTLIPVTANSVLGFAVGLSGGTFLYISTSDLLPMAHENNQDYQVPFFFLTGFLAILLMSLF
jgi:zinc transporter ZupT